MTEKFQITGMLSASEGVNPTNILIKIFERDLPARERRSGIPPAPLGETRTDDQGHFKLTYSPEQFSDGEGVPLLIRVARAKADLSFRVFSADGNELPIKNVRALERDYGPDDIIFNAPSLLEVAITVSPPEQKKKSEYENLINRIAPVIGDVPIVELADDDINFLIAELGFNQSKEMALQLHWLRRCALLASNSLLSMEAFYGWGRKDLPWPFPELADFAIERLPAVLDVIFDTSEEHRRSALIKACDENIIPEIWQNLLDETENKLQQSRPLQRHGTGKLIDKTRNTPLGNLTVEISNPSAKGLRAKPVSLVADASGLFPLLYARTVDSAVPPKLQLKVFKPENTKRDASPKPIFETEIFLDADEQHVIEVLIPMPAVATRPNHKIEKVIRAAKFEMPAKLTSFLESKNIKTLADIRHSGGLSGLTDLPVEVDHLAVRKLEAHADLARVNSDPRINEALIQKGFDSVHAIAQSTRARFVNDTYRELGDFNAGKIHVVAQAQVHFLNGVIAGELAAQTNNYKNMDQVLSAEDALQEVCSCRDCETAVSPVAYLIDLVSYTLKNVTDAGAVISLQSLMDKFYLPLSDLAVDCKSLDAQVPQVRLCVEVLRKFIGARPLADANKEQALDNAEKAFRFAVYEALLLRMGTSYAELRLAQNADAETRQTLANRLQIPLGNLNKLYLDPLANLPELTEKRLEELFGLVDTTRNPFIVGPLPELQQWRVEQLRKLWHEQDFPSDFYEDGHSHTPLKLLPVGIAFAPPTLANRIEHNAESQQLEFRGAMSFEERTTLLALSPDADYQIAIRQLYHQSQCLPIIDPDLIGPDDLRNPVPGNPAFDVWKSRREWVDTRLSALAAMVRPIAVGSQVRVPDLDAMLNALYAPVAYGNTNLSVWPQTIPVADFDKLNVDLSGLDPEGARTRIEDELNLSVESFNYLMRIRAKNTAWWADQRNEKVSVDEWMNLPAILVQAIKRRYFLTWRAEENSKGIALGPDQFWNSLTQPSEGIWPPVIVVGIPLIDPQLIKLNELPDSAVGARANELWNKRSARLVDVRDKLKELRETGGFDVMLKWALGHPNENNPLQHNLNTLENELNDNDPDIVDAAIRKVADDLHLTIENFRRLLVIKTKNANPANDKKPTAVEWEEVYELLAPARKIKHEYPVWIQEEQNPATGLVYWTALKARLPTWRSSLESRANWQAALRTRSRSVILDPDRVGISDLRDPIPGNRAFDLYDARRIEIDNQLTQLQQGFAKTAAGFNSRIENILGIKWEDLLHIAIRSEQGHHISGRLEQVGLEFSSFNCLVRAGKLLGSGAAILDAEWEDVHNILMQVWKHRKSSVWLAKEKEKNLTLSPDDFQLLHVNGPLPIRPLVNVWRSPRSARQDWEDKLQTRINQQTAVIDALTKAVSAAEEQTLTQLRNTLIVASNAPGISTEDEIRFEQQAKWITENLQIDAKMSGCTMTTRVAQAIETIQGINTVLRTGQTKDHFNTWQLDLTNFDEEWKWMGSYPSWRGAMFVFLYPELLAQPGLKRTDRQTPGLKALLQKTQNNFNFTPEQACEAAKRYSEYFEDVCTLKVQVTCTATTRVERGSCNKTVVDERCYFYMFGLGGRTGKVYWSRYDFASNSGYAQEFWEPVADHAPDFVNIKELFGAVPFKTSSGKRFIFLFGKKVVENKTSLVFVKIGLEEKKWEFKALDHPQGDADFNAVVCQSDSEIHAPHFIFYGRANDDLGRYRERKLNLEGSDWETEDFWPLYLGSVEGLPGKEVLRGAARFSDGSFVLAFRYKLPNGFSSQISIGVCILAPKTPDNSMPSPDRYGPIGSSRYFEGGVTGLFSWPSADDVFLFTSRSIKLSSGTPSLTTSILGHEDKLYSMKSLFLNADPSSLVREVAPPFPSDFGSLFLGTSRGPRRLLPTWGLSNYDGGKTKQLIYRSHQSTKHYRPLYINDPLTGYFLPNPPSVPVLPDIFGPFDISTGLSDAELTQRAGLQKAAATSIGNYPASLQTYLEEAFYSVRVALALALHRSQEFLAGLDWFRTVYADGLKSSLRKIHPGLLFEETLPNIYKRADDWLLDPLDPHSIAATRQNTYTRFTILAIIQCLLDYADTEFTRDTPESNPNAKRLYLRALDLLDFLQDVSASKCDESIGVLEGFLDAQWQGHVQVLRDELRSISNPDDLQTTVSAINAEFQRDQSPAEKLRAAREHLQRATMHKSAKISEVIEKKIIATAGTQKALLKNRHLTEVLDSITLVAEQDFQRATALVTGLTEPQLIKKSSPLAWLRQPLLSDAREITYAQSVQSQQKKIAIQKVREDGVAIDAITKDYLAELVTFAEAEPTIALNIVKKDKQGFIPTPILGFCIPQNPLLKTLRMRAEVNLLKLRACRNIAGLKRVLEPYSAPTDAQTGLPQISASGQIVLPGTQTLAPTLYRYETLIDRAKQLVQLAAQIESSFIAALQNKDNVSFNVLKARQELKLADAGVSLQDLRVIDAQSKIELSTLAQIRTQIQIEHYETLIVQDQSENEKLALRLLGDADSFLDTADDLQVIASVIYFSKAAYSIGSGVIAGAVGGLAGGVPGVLAGGALGAVSGILGSAETVASGFSALAGGFSTRAQIRSTRSSIHAMLASFERRKQDWVFQRDVANQDMAIANHQIQIATNESNIIQQERVIAGFQQSQARDSIEFLTTKQFGTPERYERIISILESVYRYFLQQATAMARLGEQQLAFTRQEIAPAFLHSDYWTLGDTGSGSSSTDLRGITGSARLLQDIYKLDQYAFESRKRKLPLTKIISLSRLAPLEFQQFRESGVITFATPMELFDQDFPGHYLRLISRISVSVVALIPPIQGIHATLTSSGLSRVVIGPDVFQRITIRREPETITLSSPMNDTGIFDLEPQAEMLRPFEGTGVDTIWEFRMPKAANQFDFLSCADVLITIDYSALHSSDYQAQVIQALPSTLSSEASFSFRNHFPDQWFDLHNPEQTQSPMIVRFRTIREDFSPNLDILRIEHISLYCSRSEKDGNEISVTHLKFTEAGSNGAVGTGASTIEGLISTRFGNGAGWNSMIGKSPIGEWELALPNTQEVRERFKNSDIYDLLLVISFSGKLPDWPS
jgi:hypothetical protein